MLSAAVVCLALTMYHEGRGEGPVGMLAIGQVVLNRSENAPRWPKDICDVVHQGGSLPLRRCQFIWYCDGLSDRPTDSGAWLESLALSSMLLEGRARFSLLYKATCYYSVSRSIPPVWVAISPFIFQVGKHRFYDCINKNG